MRINVQKLLFLGLLSCRSFTWLSISLGLLSRRLRFLLDRLGFVGDLDLDFWRLGSFSSLSLLGRLGLVGLLGSGLWLLDLKRLKNIWLIPIPSGAYTFVVHLLLVEKGPK